MNSFFSKAAELERSGISFAVITFTSGRGHLPQVAGAKAIVTTDGLQFGTVGGGKVEARAISEAQELLRRSATEPVQITWNLQRDLDMTCGGEMSFLFETHFPSSWNIVIYGAGHVAQALVRVLAGVEAQLICVDARPEWREKLPSQANLQLRDWSEPALKINELPRNSYHVVVTQDHASDVPILAALAKVPSPYVGVIGSATKAAKVRAELAAMGCDASYIEKILCPMGLKIGGNRPGEIAISIAAQLLQFKDGKK